MDQFKQIIEEYLNDVKNILNCNFITLQSILKNKSMYQFPAVYIIYTPKNKLIYVGKTKTEFLCDRIYQHIHGNKNSSLKEMINYYDIHYKNSKLYKIKFLEIKNKRKRGLFEYFLISLLNPKYNRVSN